ELPRLAHLLGAADGLPRRAEDGAALGGGDLRVGVPEGGDRPRPLQRQGGGEKAQLLGEGGHGRAPFHPPKGGMEKPGATPRVKTGTSNEAPKGRAIRRRIAVSASSGLTCFWPPGFPGRWPGLLHRAPSGLRGRYWSPCFFRRLTSVLRATP